jgi:hypothetical protein
MVMDALKRSMDRMGAEDALVLRMLFADGRSLAEVSRVLKLDYMRLYRRLPKLREMLRRYLEDAGVGAHHVHGILGGEDDDAS